MPLKNKHRTTIVVYRPTVKIRNSKKTKNKVAYFCDVVLTIITSVFRILFLSENILPAVIT